MVYIEYSSGRVSSESWRVSRSGVSGSFFSFFSDPEAPPPADGVQMGPTFGPKKIPGMPKLGYRGQRMLIVSIPVQFEYGHCI